jgi:hypothetical protein
MKKIPPKKKRMRTRIPEDFCTSPLVPALRRNGYFSFAAYFSFAPGIFPSPGQRAR